MTIKRSASSIEVLIFFDISSASCKAKTIVSPGHQLLKRQTFPSIMKQKIVIEVICKKRRSKAMAMAATKDGVTSVALDGQNPNQLVVVGDDVDAACLIEYLRKKVGQASLVTVEKVVEKAPEKKKDPPPACVCKVPPYCYQPPMGFCHGAYVEYPPGCNVCRGNGFHWPWY